MVKVQVRQENIRYIVESKTGRLQRFFQGIFAVQELMAEKPGILFIADAIVDQD